MTKKYYKTDCETVLSAIKSLNKKKDELSSKIKKIADHFNAKAITSTSMTGISFAGLELNNYYRYSWEAKSPIREDKILWTVPNTNNISRPRSSLTKKHFKGLIIGMSDSEAKEYMKRKREKLKALQSEYAEMTKDVERISFDEFFGSIGTDWGNLMFGGLNWFEHEGFVYLCSGLDLSSNATEITGSEFEAAKKLTVEGVI